MTSPVVELVDVTRNYGDAQVLKGINLTIRDGEFLSLLGPSGCGKTTTLRLLAGFDTPTSGKVLIDGVESNDVPPNRRPVNTVFQSYALFPHLNIEQNVAYGLRRKKWSRNDIRPAVGEALEMVGLSHLSSRHPLQLSGGQQQRVALARAVVNRPKLLLLDEPLGALDLKLRQQMQLELMRIHQQLGTTFVYVTHDQEEALVMSDRIAVMNAGSIEQLGTGQELYDRPATPFVADFIGSSNMLSGSLARQGPDIALEVKGSRITIAMAPDHLENGADVRMMIRPERIDVTKSDAGERGVVSGRVLESIFLGTTRMFFVDTALGHLKATAPYRGTDLAIEVGDDVDLRWTPSDVVVMAA